jgi:hypothetical protein
MSDSQRKNNNNSSQKQQQQNKTIKRENFNNVKTNKIITKPPTKRPGAK